MIALAAQFLLERFHEGTEHVQHHALAGLGGHDGAHILIHQGHEDDGTLALALRGLIDLLDHAPGLVHGIHEGPAYMSRSPGKLRQDGVAESLGGDTGAIGHKKYRSVRHRTIIMCTGPASPFFAALEPILCPLRPPRIAWSSPSASFA